MSTRVAEADTPEYARNVAGSTELCSICSRYNIRLCIRYNIRLCSRYNIRLCIHYNIRL